MKKVVVKTSKSVVKGYLDALITTIGYGYAEQIGLLSLALPPTAASAVRAALAMTTPIDLFIGDDTYPTKVYAHKDSKVLKKILPCGFMQLVYLVPELVNPSPENLMIAGTSEAEIRERLYTVIDRILDIPLKKDWSGYILGYLELEGLTFHEPTEGNYSAVSVSIDSNGLLRDIQRGLKKGEISI